MEKNKQKNEEILSRREFFNKTAKGALPILGISLFGSALLTSCEPDDGGLRGCSCSDTCSGSCETDCSGTCDGCTGTCYHSGCHSL